MIHYGVVEGFGVHNCYEISKLPVLVDTDFSQIEYDEIYDFVEQHKDKFGIQMCNLCEINAESCTSREKFLRFCKDAAVLGTLQAGYASFPYLGEVTEAIVRREALLGVSITGWMNNPKLFNPTLLKEGANLVKQTNKEIAKIIGINPAARTTTVKPSGNASVILGTASGIHPDHSERFFRIMQLNKDTNTAKWLKNNMEFLLEESVWSATNSDYVVFVPIENPKNGLFKKDMYGIKHLEIIKLVQENWVREGTDRELSVYDGIHHNVSSTVIIDDKEKMVEYILEHKDIFNAVSFLSNYGDKDFNQAPFTSVLTLEELVETYGKAVIFASGLIVDGLHYFDNNLWLACDLVLDHDEKNPIIGTREQVLLRKYWIKRTKRFAKNYFGGDIKKMVYCLKDVHLFHKWETVNRDFRLVDFSKILNKPEYKDIGDYGAMSCSGGSCEITKI
jgi:ribonucleoside-diphosphate reductase alpha chain